MSHYFKSLFFFVGRLPLPEFSLYIDFFVTRLSSHHVQSWPIGFGEINFLNSQSCLLTKNPT